MRLIWTRSASTDRSEACAYIRRHNPTAATALNRLFINKANRLAQYPRMGRPGRAPGTRELVVHPNYILVYELSDDAIHILHVLHAARHRP